MLDATRFTIIADEKSYRRRLEMLEVTKTTPTAATSGREVCELANDMNDVRCRWRRGRTTKVLRAAVHGVASVAVDAGR